MPPPPSAAHQLKQIRPLPAPRVGTAGATAAPHLLAPLLGDLCFNMLSSDPSKLPPISLLVAGLQPSGGRLMSLKERGATLNA